MAPGLPATVAGYSKALSEGVTISEPSVAPDLLVKWRLLKVGLIMLVVEWREVVRGARWLVRGPTQRHEAHGRIAVSQNVSAGFQRK